MEWNGGLRAFSFECHFCQVWRLGFDALLFWILGLLEVMWLVQRREP